ncbi:MAG: hypothetical protein LLG05_14035 [Porphyromonadaceae bacterium]|nr:hypothetical protein [Porphyromonadaceae bacterium]
MNFEIDGNEVGTVNAVTYRTIENSRLTIIIQEDNPQETDGGSSNETE